MPNRLAAETSPYLRQHAVNPVDWYPWGDEAFERARREDRPVLLSVGYSSCHWCHVMAHESFENPEIAALMNELFVSIKVDREERPDVDRIYLQAVQALTGEGGWPMTVFLTPDRVPFFGGTYFPPEDRHGMRGFPFILRAAADSYHNRREHVREAGDRLRELMRSPRLPAPAEEPDASRLDHAVRTLVAQSDQRLGGWGGGPKFPHAAAIDLLLRRHRATGDPAAWQVAAVALDRMSRGGIFDQVGGGFHRYSVDGAWAVPHFEKMLYDNALLVAPYLHAHQLTGEVRWRRVVEQTLDYLLREMRLDAGGFASAQDADSPGGEGAYFVWTPAQLREELDDEDVALAARLFAVDEVGNFEGGRTVLSLLQPLDEAAAAAGISPAELESRLDRIRARLLEARARRPAPDRDDKVITSWNALAVRALAEAGAGLGRGDYVAAARAAADFLLGELVRDGVVLRTWMGGTAKITGFLEDVAYLADALVVLYEATGEPRYLRRSLELAEQIPRRYGGEEGLYDTDVGSERLVVRPLTLDDNPIPAGRSIAAHAYLRLGALTGDGRWRERALELIRPLAEVIGRAPLAVPNLAAAMDQALSAPLEIAIAGAAHGEDTRQLLRAARAGWQPNAVLAWGEPDGIPLLADRPAIGGRATAYVCHGFACREPITDAARLRAVLEESGSPAAS